MKHRLALPVTLALGITVACHNAPTVPSLAAVNYVLVAPLCSSIIPVEFTIDRERVGVDTFRVGLANAHTVSRAFILTEGQHTVEAKTTSGYVWPVMTVTLARGATVSDSLPFYCS